MAHELLGERFFGHRTGAWHSLGTVRDEEMGAEQALDQIGEPEVYAEQLYTKDGTLVPYRAIQRSPVPEDPQIRTFGIVSGEYQLVTPRDFCQAWDRRIHRPTDTMGLLYKGSTLFVTTTLPTFDVKGDEISTSLAGVSPMSGSEAIQVMLTPERIVCSNTLRVAREVATESYRINHDQNAIPLLEQWLEHIVGRFTGRVETIKQAFTSFAEKHVDEALVAYFLETVYNFPSEPSEDAPEGVVIERRARYEADVRYFTARRNATRELFEGKGTELNTEATKGTVWGLYNAVTELESWAPARKASSRATDVLFGFRSQSMEKAYRTALELVKA